MRKIRRRGDGTAFRRTGLRRHLRHRSFFQRKYHRSVRAALGGERDSVLGFKALGLDVFFAWEYSLGWAHFLTYGLDADWLLAHPDLLEWDMGRYIAEVHEAGGYLFHAHPWRVTGNPVMRMIPHGIDGVEIINANRSDGENLPAADFARSFGHPVTAGSDIHSVKQKRLAGVYTESRLTGGTDYARAVLERKVQIFTDLPVL